MLILHDMNQATFHFEGDLNDFLLKGQGSALTCTFNSGQSVKHLIESLGVPHTEVGGILVNGSQVNFGYLVQNGDLVQVYPVEPELNVPDREACFVVDNHLGRLAYSLRMLGFDTLYRNDYQDDELAQIAEKQGRILLTRDRRLLMRNQVQRGYCVRSLSPRTQIIEVVQRYHLRDQIVPFRRCMRCNGLLRAVSKDAVLERLEPLTKQYFDEFRICPDCEQVYWKGSHYERMARLVEQIRGAAGEQQIQDKVNGSEGV